jgi:Holliday junction resolvasome RuvABC endonuclease subunit
MTSIIIAGIDGSLRNFGMTKMSFELETGRLDIADMKLIETLPGTVKSVRASSDNLLRAQTISQGVEDFLKDVTACFAEVPSGGQDYNAVLGFGIVIGIYAGIRQPLLEVSPSETKKATVGTRTASKQEMIEWAFETYPNAPWLLAAKNGPKTKKGEPTLKNEHLADAAAIVHAGILTPAFQQVRAILSQRAA